MKCKICYAQARRVFSARVMNKYDVEYFRCDNCEYLFTENPHWLDEAYERAINISDTGIISRNQHFTKSLSSISVLRAGTANCGVPINTIFIFFWYN